MLANRFAACFLAAAAAFISPFVGASTIGLRSHTTGERNLKKPSSLECTILAVSYYELPGSSFDGESFECEIDPEDVDGVSGISLPIIASAAQTNQLKKS